MSKIINQRMMARVEGDFVVFILGMRINKLWKVHKWFPIAMSMPKMLKELAAKPELGLLGIQTTGGFPPVIIQYWRSFEHLESYARDKNAAHLPALKNFNKLISGNSDVGIWHETYLIKEGNYENIYNNMPKYGLGKVGQLMPVSKNFEGAGERLRDNTSKIE